jgi:hypothetical protein
MRDDGRPGVGDDDDLKTVFEAKMRDGAAALR